MLFLLTGVPCSCPTESFSAPWRARLLPSRNLGKSAIRQVGRWANRQIGHGKLVIGELTVEAYISRPSPALPRPDKISAHFEVRPSTTEVIFIRFMFRRARLLRHHFTLHIISSATQESCLSTNPYYSTQHHDTIFTAGLKKFWLVWYKRGDGGEKRNGNLATKFG